MKQKIIATLLLSLILILGIGYWQYTITKPKYSLWKIKKAVDEHNLMMFEKYVDTENLVETLIDQFIETSMGNIEKKDEEVEGFDPALAKRIVINFKPQLTNIVKQKVVSFVKTGDLKNESKSQEALEKEFSLKNIWDYSGEDKNEFQGIAYVKEEGNIAYVGLKFFLEKHEENFIVDLKMRSIDNYWQVIEISNFSIIVKKLDQLDNWQYKALKKSIFEQIKKTLIVDKIEKYDFGVKWSKEVNFKLKPENKRSKKVDLIEGSFFDNDSSREQSIEILLPVDESLFPEQRGRDLLSADDNMSSRDDKELYKIDLKKFKPLTRWHYMQEILKW